MAVVQNIKEKVHLPIYDSLTVEPEKQLRSVENSSTLRFFVNVQGKTKLETNLQSASLLPHYNTFEARAMRVVISDLPPEFPDKPSATQDDEPVKDEQGRRIDRNGKVEGVTTGSLSGFTEALAVRADLDLGLQHIMELLREAQDSADKIADLAVDDEDVKLKALPTAGATTTTPLSEAETQNVLNAGGILQFTESELLGLLGDLPDKDQPAKEQTKPTNGAGTLIGKLIYNTVTTFFVGEKIMIQMPTWFFPAGAGPYSEVGKFTTHGEPTPTATFRFAEPIFIDKQQNFRVEIEIPDADVLKDIHKIYGPLFVWVVLDGYMTRDVQ
jgi:hypothetical protein